MEFKFKKKYGQNFLIQKNIIKKIISISENKSPSLVIEIGCGDGRLTKELCEKYNQVLGYEIDLEVKDYLEDNLKAYNNYKIIFDDFLKRTVKNDIKDYNYKRLYIIANLPYYITTPIIEKIINENLNQDKMIFMVQKEVGDRLSAKPSTKEYNSLSVYLNYLFDIKKEFIVNRNSFLPKPNVDSIVVSFTKKKNKYKVLNEELFYKLIRDSFKFKRKTIKNNLKDYDLEKISKVLNKYNKDLTTRAEQLNIEIFCDIANELSI